MPRHVTCLLLLLVCSLMMRSAHTLPSAALIKLIASKHSHHLGEEPPYLRLNEFPSFPAVPSADDVDQVWLEPGLNSPTSGGNQGAVDGSDAAEGEREEATPSKRFHPTAFFGSRGKRRYGHDDSDDAFGKRFQMGFVGSRGKRLGSSGRREEQGGRVATGLKRFNPSGFTGSRGKRLMPGLEALLLSQMYKKLDAEKWKRQSLLGFHAARG